MKKSISLLLLTFFSCSFSSSAFATYHACNNKFTMSYHFTRQAYGRTVESVVARTGVLTAYSNRGLAETVFWQAEQEIILEKIGQNGDFVGHTTLTASGGGGDGTYARILYPVVQYKVKFLDGMTLITDSFEVKRDLSGTRIDQISTLGQSCL